MENRINIKELLSYKMLKLGLIPELNNNNVEKRLGV